MIGAWLEGGRLRVRDDLPRPAARPREVVVRVSLAGICGTDLELARGYRDFLGVPGHEFVGVVEEGPADWIGRRVVAEINITCLTRAAPAPCALCRAGRPAHCSRREVPGILGRDGAFAERVCVPVANLHRVPDTVSDDAAVFVEPLAAAFRVLEQIGSADVQRALVLGMGRLGQLVARLLAPRLPALDAAGRSARSLSRARAAGLNVREAGALAAATYDLVVDCTGTPGGFAAARQAVRPRGTLIVKSTHINDLSIDISSIVVDEIRLLGSRCGPFGPALAALEQRDVEVLDLIDDRLPLEAAAEAFAKAAEPGVAKILLVPPRVPPLGTRGG